MHMHEEVEITVAMGITIMADHKCTSWVITSTVAVAAPASHPISYHKYLMGHHSLHWQVLT